MSKNTIHYSEYVTPKVLPWETIFADLDKVGKSQYCIAQMIGVPQPTLRRWTNGEVEPKHSIGDALLLIHERYCGNELTIKRQLEAKNLQQLRPKKTL